MGKKANGARPAAKAHLARTGSTSPDPTMREPDRRIGARTLGPVSDLERHLPSDWWRTLFNSLYLETDGDVIENDRNTGREVDLLIRSVGLERNDRILDLCCGQGRHSLELARRGFPHCHRARPLALSDPPRPQARQAAQPAGLVSRRRCAALSSRRRRVSLRLHPRQLVRLFRAAGGRPRRARSGQAGPRLGRLAGHGFDGRRLDAPSFRAALLGVGRPEPFRLPRARPRRGWRPADQPRGRRARRARRHRRPVLCRAALFEGTPRGAADRRRFRQCPLSFAAGAGFASQPGSRHGGAPAVRDLRGAAPGAPAAAPRRAVLRCHRDPRRSAPARSGQAQRALRTRRMSRRSTGSKRRCASCRTIAFAFSTIMPRCLPICGRTARISC